MNINSDFLKKSIFKPSTKKRYLFFLLSDFFSFTLSILLAYDLRFNFSIPYEQYHVLFISLILFPLFKIFIFHIYKLYKLVWRYVGINELYNLIKANLTASAILAIIVLFSYFNYLKGFPRSILIIDFIISLLLTSLVRISKRLVLEILNNKKSDAKKTIIVGAGNVGEFILRDLARLHFKNYYPIGFLDDDENKVNTYIHNTKVLGKLNELGKICKTFNPDAVFIAIPNIGFQKLKEIYTLARKCGVKEIKIIPRIYATNKPQISVKDLEEVKISDLLGRKEITVDFNEIKKFLKGKRILITGAAGSIGSEISLQVCNFEPEQIILFEIDETQLFWLELRLKEKFPLLKDKIVPVLGDIKDHFYLEKIFKEKKPHIVFHAAAYKHVPIVELNPSEAIKNNIFGTYYLCEKSIKHNVEKFIFISTDKAVNPTSFMGATKRFCEQIVTAFNQLNKTKFISVRFGNVLGSRGSVLPIFLKQLKKGGPLKITHPNMVRYFMTIPEAVSLVLQASVIGQGGDIMVLDMGEPVKIVQLAEELVRLHGLRPNKDIKFTFTGIRPGEKLYEELLTSKENKVLTKHKKIYKALITKNYDLNTIKSILFDELKDIIENDCSCQKNNIELKHILSKYIPGYKPWFS